MLSRIKNSQSRNHKKVQLPSSNFKIKISEVLKNEGYIIDYKVSSDDKKPTLEIELKYNYGSPEDMVGHKLGEFAPTRQFFGHTPADKKAKADEGAKPVVKK